MTAWPETVPSCPALDSYSETGPQGAVIRTTMERGPDKVRKRTTAAPRGAQAVFPGWTATQVVEFQAWFEDDIAFGALPFDMVNPITGQVQSWRFVGSYELGQSGTRWQMSATFEILP